MKNPLCSERVVRTENQHFVSRKFSNFPSSLNCGNSDFPRNKYAIFNIFMILFVTGCPLRAPTINFKQNQPQTLLHMKAGPSACSRLSPSGASVYSIRKPPRAFVPLPTRDGEAETMAKGQPCPVCVQGMPGPSRRLQPLLREHVLRPSDTPAVVWGACPLVEEESFGLENTQPAPPNEAITAPAPSPRLQAGGASSTRLGAAVLTNPPRKKGAAHGPGKGRKKMCSFRQRL